MSARSRQAGQVMPIVALLSSVLVGFVGLVIDVGGVSSDHELAQAAADGAALTAAYDMLQGGTEANATTHAQAVLTQEGLATSALTMTYLDAAGNATLNTAQVATVQAAVAYNHATRFLPILGVSTVGISGTAQAAVTPAQPPCGLCVMHATGNSLSLGGSSHVTVSGAGTVVNSTSNPNVTVAAGSVLTSRTNRLAANHVTGTGTMSPAATVGAAVADPLPALATPALPGFSIPYTSPASGSTTANPGAYSAVTINGTFALTLNPGTYIFSGPLTVNGGTVTGTGVTLYFTCGAGGFNPPVNCAGGGAAGGNLIINGGVVSISAPTSGTYQGVVIFGDRNNNSTNTLAGGSGSLVTTGTIYTELMPWALTHASDTYTLNSELIASGLTTAASTTLNLDYTSAQNAPGQVGTTAAATPALVL